MTEAEARELHAATRRPHDPIHVVPIREAIDASRPLAANLDAVFEVVSVTDTGFVQLRYLNREYGPTLHYAALRLLRRTYEPIDPDD
jgi:hypothetical protein